MKKFLLIFFAVFLGTLFLTGCFEGNQVKITFDSNGGTKVEAITIDKDASLTLPTNPTKEGFEFRGWFLDKDLNTELKNFVITKSITLYAKWEAVALNTFEVTFNSDGGSSVTKQTVNNGQKAIKPETDPTKTGFTFKGWYVGEVLFDFNTVITTNTTLVAKWEAVALNTFEVTFNSDGGSGVAKQTVNSGEKASAPLAPTKEGFTFEGWYLGEVLFDFNNPITVNTTLVAKWKQSDNIFDVIIPGEVTYSSNLKTLIYNFLISMEDGIVGYYDFEEDIYIPYDFEDQSVQEYINLYVSAFKYGRVTEEDIVYLMGLLEEEKITIQGMIEEGKNSEAFKYVFGQLVDKVFEEVSEDVIGQLLYGYSVTMIEVQINLMKDQKDYYAALLLEEPDNAGYILTIEMLNNNILQLEEAKTELLDLGPRDIIITSRIIMKIYKSFIENNGLSIFDLTNTTDITNEEILEIIGIVVDTIRGIDISEETWKQIFMLPTDDETLLNIYAYIFAGANDEVATEIVKSLIESEYTLFGNNFKLFLDAFATCLDNLTLEQIEFLKNGNNVFVDEGEFYYETKEEVIKKENYHIEIQEPIFITEEELNDLKSFFENLNAPDLLYQLDYNWNQEKGLYELIHFHSSTFEIDIQEAIATYLINIEAKPIINKIISDYFQIIYIVYFNDETFTFSQSEYLEFIQNHPVKYYKIVDGVAQEITEDEYYNELSVYNSKMTQFALSSFLTFINTDVDKFEAIIMEALENAEEVLSEFVLDAPIGMPAAVTFAELIQKIEEITTYEIIDFSSLTEFDEMLEEFGILITGFMSYNFPILLSIMVPTLN